MSKRLSDDELLNELKIRLDEQRQSNEELRDLTTQLKDVNKKLTESEALKSHFLSNIRNEIINPFASIIGLSRQITMMQPHDFKKIQTIAALINSEAFNLDFQLQNIFAAAEIEAGDSSLHIYNVEIIQLINTVIDSHRPDAQKRKIEIVLENNIKDQIIQEYYFCSDSEKLYLILSNLLSNAIRFSYESNKIILKVWIEEDKLFFSVEDFGIGIEEEKQKVIFERFKQLDVSINEINRGYGLGLSVSKAYLDLMGGELEVKSVRGSGSLFTISVPDLKGLGNIDGIATDGNEFMFDSEDVF